MRSGHKELLKKNFGDSSNDVYLLLEFALHNCRRECKYVEDFRDKSPNQIRLLILKMLKKNNNISYE